MIQDEFGQAVRDAAKWMENTEIAFSGGDTPANGGAGLAERLRAVASEAQEELDDLRRVLALTMERGEAPPRGWFFSRRELDGARVAVRETVSGRDPNGAQCGVEGITVRLPADPAGPGGT